MAASGNKSIGIVGGGIGGIAAAVVLNQAGIEVVVYERTSERPRGRRRNDALAKCHPSVAGNGLARKRIGARRTEHAFFGENEPRPDSDEHCARKIRRSGDLHAPKRSAQGTFWQLCHQSAFISGMNCKIWNKLEAKCIFVSRTVLSPCTTRWSARMEFGRACDRSCSVRTNPVYRGYTVWRGVAGYDGDEMASGSNSESWGAGKRFGILNTGHRKFTWYATSNVPPHHVDTTYGRKHEVQEMFRGWHDPITDLIDATEESAILKNGACDFAPLPSWGRGMVTLLGDAAHPCTPNLGQGGCMALEDALVLAKCVKREPSLRTAIRRYELLRYQRTRRIQQRSRLMGRIGQWQSPLFVSGRRFVTSFLPPRLIERNLRRVYAYQT